MRHVFQSFCYYQQVINNKNTMENYNQAYQLIDEHKHYNKQALESVISSLGDCNKDYFTVAIIGAQNTGKSTLLNNLFKTSFSVLNGEAGNRTTRGVVLGRDFQEKLIIMDVEGNDSYETHAEGDQNYEKMVGSFALVGANVLLVNIFEKQLGQHSGSQYETLSTVMRICIDQFKQESPKTILFTLRDFNPNVTDQAECRSKVRADVLNIWKSVFTGTKRSADFEKYLAAPERFFTLEVAFLRQYDVDYPEDFKEDVEKLRKRFVNPSDDGYLFKKQKKEYNLPINDMVSLLDKVWKNLTSDKELNLPNEKVQVANYRCQEICSELSNAFEKDLEEKKTQARNYTALLGDLKSNFEHRTQHYNKQITEKWENVLFERVRPKIGKVITEFIENSEKELEEKFKFQIDNLFFDLEHTTDNFKVQAERVKIAVTEELITCYKNINYEIPDRKIRIEKFTAILLKLIEDDIKKRLEEDERDFENEIAREMDILIATVLRNNFNLSFYAEITRLYSAKKSELLTNFNRKLIWARGIGGNANELDDAEIKMIETLKSVAKKALENNMLEKLFEFFKENFYFDQHRTRYDYNILSDQKAIEIFTEAKEMVLNLIKYLNNFKLQPERRSSMIMTEDFDDQDEMKPLLESTSILTIQEQFQRKASDEYATVVRKRNQAHMKQVPTYLFVVIFYFIYDDIWFSYEEYPITHCLLLGLIACIGLIYAVGQGPIMRQMVQIFYESVLGLLGTVKDKADQLRKGSGKKQASQEKKEA